MQLSVCGALLLSPSTASASADLGQALNRGLNLPFPGGKKNIQGSLHSTKGKLNLKSSTAR